MTSYAKREIVSRRIEYGVAAGENVGVLYRMLRFAWMDWCQRNGKDPDGFEYDDWAEIIPRDDETVIAFTVEADAADQQDRITAVLDLVDKAETLGWDQALTHGDDIPQAIRRALGRTP